jgi:hypothetical protein
VRWRDPEGAVWLEETIPMGSLRRVTASFDTSDAEPGDWRVEVAVGAREVESYSFEIAARS